ncbi:MAG: PEP-CTERM sorting domain-containing protein, partial [Opitutales bacterium]|nr:PEP-CTERM sorting domain-containing protein [Opitutales bacterium]
EKGDSDIVVGENVTFEMYCNSSDFNLWYGANLDLSGKIIGGQNWGALYFFYGNHTAHSTAKIGVGRIQNRHASLTVLGSENGKNRYSENVAIADRTDAQVDVNYLLNEGSTFTAKDTYVEAGVVFDSNQEVMRDGASAFNFVNTKLDTGKITIGYADSTFNAENCVITVKTGIHSAGDGSITNNGTISLTDSTLTAVNVTNTGSIVLNNGTLKVTGTFTNNGTLTMDSSSKIVDANDNTVGASLSAGSTVAVADAYVSSSAAAAGVVFKGASEIDTSTVTGGDVDALPDGVTIVSAWHFDVETNGKEVEVSTMIEKGLSLDTIKIFHKADTEEAEWKLFAVGTDGIVDYDAETGVLSFTTSSFSGYAVAAPEPSAFGLLAGLGAIALAVSRRRRNRR